MQKEKEDKNIENQEGQKATFQIILYEGTDFKEKKEGKQETVKYPYIDALVQHFSLLSWVIPDHGLKLVEEYRVKEEGKKGQETYSILNLNPKVVDKNITNQLSNFLTYFETYEENYGKFEKYENEPTSWKIKKNESKDSVKYFYPDKSTGQVKQSSSVQSSDKQSSQVQGSKAAINFEFTNKEGTQKSHWLITKDKKEETDSETHANTIKYVIVDKLEDPSFRHQITVKIREGSESQTKFKHLIKQDNFQIEEEIKAISEFKEEIKEKPVVVQSTQIKNLKTIIIEIFDSQNYFRSNLPKEKKYTLERLKSDLKDNEIEYPYIEPEHERLNNDSSFQKQHFSFAFQGGGAKGISYVGVYKAVEQIKQIPIKSIIGSSAGGILALAISTGISCDFVEGLCYKLESIPKTDRYYQHQTGEFTQAEIDQYAEKIYEKLDQYGIIEPKVIKHVVKSYGTDAILGMLLQLIEQINPAMKEMLTFDGAQNKFNFQGLLFHAALMKGEEIENIGADCLIEFFRQTLAQWNSKDIKKLQQQCIDLKLGQEQLQMEHRDLKKEEAIQSFTKRVCQIRKAFLMMNILEEIGIAGQFNQYIALHKKKEECKFFKFLVEGIKQVTMKQYYDLTGIEFTCTSTDMDSQILRFFNHKTTPDLPVCKAVQMTGSFPVAFEAPKWKAHDYTILNKTGKPNKNEKGEQIQIPRKGWGKYYIHYADTRREVDLDGHEFTDGGFLANFPIKYLDNEAMRPMYFSHPNNDNTINFGFGLDYSQELQKNMSQEERKQLHKKNYQKEKIKSQLKWGLLKIFAVSPTVGGGVNFLQNLFEDVKYGLTALAGKIGGLVTSFVRKTPAAQPPEYYIEEAIKMEQAERQTKAIERKGREKAKKEEQKTLIDTGKKIVNIPLLDFASKLMQVYQNTDRNLNLQCFRNKIIIINENDDEFRQQQDEGNTLQMTFQEDQLTKIIEGVLNDVKFLNRLRVAFDSFHLESENIKDLSKKSEKTEFNRFQLEAIKEHQIKESEHLRLELNDLLYEIADLTLKECLRVRNFSKWDKINSQKQIAICKAQVQQKLKQQLNFELLDDGTDSTKETKKKLDNIKQDEINARANQLYYEEQKKLLDKHRFSDEGTENANKLYANLGFLFNRLGIELVNLPKNIFEDILKSKIIQEAFEELQQKVILRKIAEEQRQQPKKQKHKNIQKKWKRILYDAKFMSSVAKDMRNLLKIQKAKGQPYQKYIIKNYVQKSGNKHHHYQKKIEEIKKDFTKFTDPTKYDPNLNEKDKIKFFQFAIKFFCIQKIQKLKKISETIAKEAKTSKKYKKQTRVIEKSATQIENETFIGKYKGTILDSVYQKAEKGRKLLSNISFAIQTVQNLKNRLENKVLHKNRAILIRRKFQDLKQKLQWSNITYTKMREIADETIETLLMINRQIAFMGKSDSTLGFYQNNQFIADIYKLRKSESEYFFDENLQNKQRDQLEKILVRIIDHYPKYTEPQNKDQFYKLTEIKVEYKQLYQKYVIDKFFSDKLVTKKQPTSFIGRLKKVAEDDLIKKYKQTSQDKDNWRRMNAVQVLVDAIINHQNCGFLNALHKADKLFDSYQKKNWAETLQSVEEIRTKKNIILARKIQNYLFQKKAQLNKVIAKILQTQQTQFADEAYAEILYFNEKINGYFTEMRTSLMYYPQYMNNFYRKLKAANIQLPLIQRNIRNNRSKIQKLIKQSELKNTKNQKYHLVLEGVGNFHKYYCTIYKILEEVLITETECPISTITCSNYHSIFGFLLAGGKFTMNEIKKEMWKISSLIEPNLTPLIIKEFDSLKWVRGTDSQMKALQQQTWNERYNIYRQLQSICDSVNDDGLRRKIDILKMECQNSKKQFDESFQEILNHAINCIKTVQSQVTQLKRQKLAELLSLKAKKLDQTEEDYETTSQKDDKNGQGLVKVLLNYTEAILRQNILSNKIILDSFENLKDEPQMKKQAVWKGVVVRSLLNTKKLKFYIQEKLMELKLNPSITLQNFYKKSERQILLNFTTIDNVNQRISFINKNTCPNMPVWAAILAASSMPFLFQEFKCPVEWTINESQSLKQRVIADYFLRKQNEIQLARFSSANALASLPLELVTNPQIIARQIHKDQKKKEVKKVEKQQEKMGQINNRRKKEPAQNQVFLTFAFKTIQVKDRSAYYQKKPYFFTHPGSSTRVFLKRDGFSALKKIIKRSQNLQTLTTNTNSNDNLIKKIYADKAIQLPIKINTLDFKQITEEVQGKKQLTAKANDAIDRAYYITREFFQGNLIFQRPTNKFFKTVTKEITFRMSFANHPGTKEKFCRLECMSISKGIQNLKTRCILMYKLHKDSKYRHVLVDKIQFNYDQLKEKQIYFKIEYPHVVEQENNTWTKDYKTCQIRLQFDHQCLNMAGNAPTFLTNEFDYSLKYFSATNDRQLEYPTIHLLKSTLKQMKAEEAANNLLKVTYYNPQKYSSDGRWAICNYCKSQLQSLKSIQQQPQVPEIKDKKCKFSNKIQNFRQNNSNIACFHCNKFDSPLIYKCNNCQKTDKELPSYYCTKCTMCNYFKREKGKIICIKCKKDNKTDGHIVESQRQTHEERQRREQIEKSYTFQLIKAESTQSRTIKFVYCDICQKQIFDYYQHKNCNVDICLDCILSVNF